MQSIGKDLQKVIDRGDIIEISKKDEVHLKIACEASVAQEICDYFTFTVPGYTFMPAYRMRIWDGRLDYSIFTIGYYMVDYLNMFSSLLKTEIIK